VRLCAHINEINHMFLIATWRFLCMDSNPQRLFEALSMTQMHFLSRPFLPRYVLRSKSVDVQREAVRAIGNLSAEYSHTAAIVASGALMPMVATLSSPDFLCQRYAAMGVSNLATNMANQEKILQEGALAPLMSLANCDNGDRESQRYAVFGLNNVSATRHNHPQLVDSGVVALFAQLMQHDDLEIRNSAFFGIANLTTNPANHRVIMQEKCLMPLIAGTADPDPSTQLRCVGALRGLSCDEDIRALIVRRGGLEPLLRLAKSDDVEVQMETLATLCNLSLCGCIGDNPLQFLKAVDINALVSFLCSADATYRLFGAVTLGNIASDLTLQEGVVSGGALEPLVTVANASDLETQRCIAYAICNLAADEARRPSIVSEGGLPPLISLACSDDVADMKAAVATLRGLSAAPESRRQIVTSGALDAFSLAAQVEEDVEVPREAAAALCALSLNEENKLDMARAGVMADIVALAQVEDHWTVRQACGCLANLSENKDTHSFVLGDWGVGFLCELVTHDDVAMVREVSRCLTNLAGNYACHPKLMVEPVAGQRSVAEALTMAMRKVDSIATRFACLGVVNLCAVPENQAPFLNLGICEALVELACGEPREWIDLDGNGKRKRCTHLKTDKRTIFDSRVALPL
jgi:hypothetical protein